MHAQRSATIDLGTYSSLDHLAYLSFLSRHPLKFILDRLQFVRDLVHLSRLDLQLFPKFLVFSFLGLSVFFGCFT